MKLIVGLLIIILCISCRNYQYLSEQELKGFTLESNNHVYALELKIEAEATCNSVIIIKLHNRGEYSFPLTAHLDTLISMDWYGETLQM